MTITWTPAHEKIAELVSQRAGLTHASARRESDAAAIARVMRATGVRKIERYQELLARDAIAVETLAAELTIGETYFYRDSAHFQLLRDRILPEVAARKPHVIRMWSAGCASGEEAYSLALVAHELGIRERARIIGSDIARSRLESARIARYGRWSFRGVADSVINAYFKRSGQRYELNANIRDRVEFRYLNLAEDSYPSLSTGIWGFDVVFCRNVLIYFEPAAVVRVTRALVASLAEGGWLVLGAADPVADVMQQCDVITTDAGVVYRKRGVRASIRLSEPTAAPLARNLRSPPVRSPPVPAPANEPGAPLLPEPVNFLTAYAAREYDAAIALARDVLQRGDDVSAWVTLVRALANQGNLAEAESMCALALQRQREAAELWYLQAVLLTEQSQLTAAIRAARQALYLDPGWIVAHLAQGTALAAAGEREAAALSFANAERLLLAMPEAQHVPGSDSEPAGRLLEMARAQLRLSVRTSAA